MAILTAQSRRSQHQAGRVGRVLRKPQFWFGLVVLIPLVAWYIWFAYGPVLRAFWMATVDYKLLRPEQSQFVGLKHFRALLAYSRFWHSVERTVLYAIGAYVGTLPLALFVSLCLVSVVRLRRFYQFVIYLPQVVSYVAIALLFRMLMDPQMGQFNQILKALGLPTSKFVSGYGSALPSLVGIDVWKGLGFHVVIFTAGLLGIPEEMYDAARVDGANAWQKFWRVTFPLLGHTLALESIIMVMGALQAFTNAYVMDTPADSCEFLNVLIYNEAFVNMRFGLATAAAFVLFLVILVLTLVQLRLIRPRWRY